MAEWMLHWLEAEGALDPWRTPIEAELAQARQAISRLVEAPRLDILIERVHGSVIPERGFGGHAFRRSLFALRIDPDNPNFEESLRSGTVRRSIAHEVHHCLRMAGPGYGRSLGEALVSEGLAGHFSRQLFGGDPEPWECAVDDAVLRAHLPDDESLAASNYDHAAWFFGAGGKRPRWYGYSLGYALVGSWLDTVTAMDGAAWTATPAQIILAAGLAKIRQDRRSE